jgi:hypothetical protein
MGYYVSRQRRYEDNRLLVEIACGGSKFAGKDILPITFNGEQKNLVSPIDAVNVSLRLIEEWHQKYWDEPKGISIVNADGKGSCQLFDPHSKKDLEKLERWAQSTFKNMAKCCACQKPIGNMNKAYETEDLPNRVACSEICLANIYRTIFGVEMPRVSSNKDKKYKAVAP